MSKEPLPRASAPARPSVPIHWVPAERLGSSSMDPRLRAWLIGKGLLTLRMKSACRGRVAARVIYAWPGALSAAHRSALRVSDTAGLFRDAELSCGDQVWVFEQAVVPDGTLSRHAWLAELGDAELGETLSSLSRVERGPHEYAWLP